MEAVWTEAVWTEAVWTEAVWTEAVPSPAQGTVHPVRPLTSEATERPWAKVSMRAVAIQLPSAAQYSVYIPQRCTLASPQGGLHMPHHQVHRGYVVLQGPCPRPRPLLQSTPPHLSLAFMCP